MSSRKTPQPLGESAAFRAASNSVTTTNTNYSKKNLSSKNSGSQSFSSSPQVIRTQNRLLSESRKEVLSRPQISTSPMQQPYHRNMPKSTKSQKSCSSDDLSVDSAILAHVGKFIDSFQMPNVRVGVDDPKAQPDEPEVESNERNMPCKLAPIGVTSEAQDGLYSSPSGSNIENTLSDDLSVDSTFLAQVGDFIDALAKKHHKDTTILNYDQVKNPGNISPENSSRVAESCDYSDTMVSEVLEKVEQANSSLNITSSSASNSYPENVKISSDLVHVIHVRDNTDLDAEKIEGSVVQTSSSTSSSDAETKYCYEAELSGQIASQSFSDVSIDDMDDENQSEMATITKAQYFNIERVEKDTYQNEFVSEQNSVYKHVEDQPVENDDYDDQESSEPERLLHDFEDDINQKLCESSYTINRIKEQYLESGESQNSEAQDQIQAQTIGEIEASPTKLLEGTEGSIQNSVPRSYDDRPFDDLTRIYMNLHTVTLSSKQDYRKPSISWAQQIARLVQLNVLPETRCQIVHTIMTFLHALGEFENQLSDKTKIEESETLDIVRDDSVVELVFELNADQIDSTSLVSAIEVEEAIVNHDCNSNMEANSNEDMNNIEDTNALCMVAESEKATDICSLDFENDMSYEHDMACLDAQKLPSKEIIVQPRQCEIDNDTGTCAHHLDLPQDESLDDDASIASFNVPEGKSPEEAFLSFASEMISRGVPDPIEAENLLSRAENLGLSKDILNSIKKLLENTEHPESEDDQSLDEIEAEYCDDERFGPIEAYDNTYEIEAFLSRMKTIKATNSSGPFETYENTDETEAFMSDKKKILNATRVEEPTETHNNIDEKEELMNHSKSVTLPTSPEVDVDLRRQQTTQNYSSIALFVESSSQSIDNSESDGLEADNVRVDSESPRVRGFPDASTQGDTFDENLNHKKDLQYLSVFEESELTMVSDHEEIVEENNDELSVDSFIIPDGLSTEEALIAYAEELVANGAPDPIEVETLLTRADNLGLSMDIIFRIMQIVEEAANTERVEPNESSKEKKEELTEEESDELPLPLFYYGEYRSIIESAISRFGADPKRGSLGFVLSRNGSMRPMILDVLDLAIPSSLGRKSQVKRKTRNESQEKSNELLVEDGSNFALSNDDTKYVSSSPMNAATKKTKTIFVDVTLAVEALDLASPLSYTSGGPLSCKPRKNGFGTAEEALFTCDESVEDEFELYTHKFANMETVDESNQIDGFINRFIALKHGGHFPDANIDAINLPQSVISVDEDDDCIEVDATLGFVNRNFSVFVETSEYKTDFHEKENSELILQTDFHEKENPELILQSLTQELPPLESLCTIIEEECETSIYKEDTMDIQTISGLIEEQNTDESQLKSEPESIESRISTDENVAEKLCNVKESEAPRELTKNHPGIFSLLSKLQNAHVTFAVVDGICELEKTLESREEKERRRILHQYKLEGWKSPWDNPLSSNPQLLVKMHKEHILSGSRMAKLPDGHKILLPNRPDGVNQVAADKELVNHIFVRRQRLVGVRRPWQMSKEERTRNHAGYKNISQLSLENSLSVMISSEKILKEIDWEERQVEQLFLHETSLEISNWFGRFTKEKGNEKIRGRLCQHPKPVKLHWNTVPEAGAWEEEWYTSWQNFRQNPNNLALENGSAEETKELEVPRVGILTTIRLKPGERVSRVTYEHTSNLRHSRFRKKWYPDGVLFPCV